MKRLNGAIACEIFTLARYIHGDDTHTKQKCFTLRCVHVDKKITNVDLSFQTTHLVIQVMNLESVMPTQINKYNTFFPICILCLLFCLSQFTSYQDSELTQYDNPINTSTTMAYYRNRFVWFDCIERSVTSANGVISYKMYMRL